MEETASQGIKGRELLLMLALLLACGPALAIFGGIAVMTLASAVVELLQEGEPGMLYFSMCFGLMPMLGGYGLLRAILSRGRKVNPVLLLCGILPATLALCMFNEMLSLSHREAAATGYSLLACVLVGAWYLFWPQRA